MKTTDNAIHEVTNLSAFSKDISSEIITPLYGSYTAPSLPFRPRVTICKHSTPFDAIKQSNDHPNHITEQN